MIRLDLLKLTLFTSLLALFSLKGFSDTPSFSIGDITNVTVGAQTGCDNGDNTYTQELTIEYGASINSGDLIVNGQVFAVTSSPQTIVLTGLSADYNDVDIAITHTDSSCEILQADVWTAPAPCSIINTTCEDALWLEVKDECEFLEFSNEGAGDSGASSGCGWYQGSDVWFKTYMPASGRLVVQTDGGVNNDPVVSLFVGDCQAGSISAFACNSNSSPTGSGGIVVINDDTHAGELIYIRIFEDFDITGGTFSICAFEPTIPPNDNISNAFPLTVGTECSMTEFNNIHCTNSDPDNNFPPGCGFYSGGDVWFTVEVPASGKLVVDSDDYTIGHTCLAAYVNNMGSAEILDCNTGSSDDGNEGELIFNDMSLAGQNLLIRVWNWNNSNGGTFGLCAWEPAIPDNDFCTNAIELTVSSSCSLVTYGGNIATSNDDHPSPGCGFYNGADFWFSVTVPATGHLVIECDNGTNTSPVLSVYEGDCNDMTVYQCNANSSQNGGFGRILIHDDAMANVELLLRVHRWNSPNAGTFDLCAFEPDLLDYDFCELAAPIVVGEDCVMQEFGNDYATDFSDVPSPGCGFYNGADYWFTTTVPASGHLIIDTDPGTNTSPVVSVYQGTCDDFTVYACDASSSSNGGHARVEIHDDALAGEDIYLRVSRWNSDQAGSFSICAFEYDIIDNDFCADAMELSVDGSCNYQEINATYATEEDGISNPSCGFYGGADVWFSAVVPATGQAIIDLNAGTNTSPVLQVYTGDCGSLVNYDCDTGSSDDGVGQVTIDDISLAGETIMIRVYRWNSIQNGTFWICAYDPTGCTFYNMEQGDIGECEPFTGLYDQEIVLEYLNEPGTGMIDVNGVQFPITGSPQIVTLTDQFANNEFVDVTAFFTDQPSCTVSINNLINEPSTCYCPGDLDMDGAVGASDLLGFLSEFGCTSNCNADFDLDGVVSAADLLIFLSQIGLLCP